MTTSGIDDADATGTTLPVAVVSVDDHDVVVGWSESATALFGHPASETLGRPFLDLDAWRTEGGPPRAFTPEARRLGPWEGEHLARRPDGEVLSVHSRLDPVVDPGSGGAGSVLLSVDIGPRRALERALAREVQRDPLAGPGPLAPAAVDLRDSRDVDAVAAVALLAEELAIPLSVLAGYAEVLAGRSDPAIRARSIAAVQGSTARARAILGRARDQMALQNGTLVLDLAPVPIDQLVEDAVALTEHLLTGDLHVALSGAVVDGDARRLITVVSTLLANAATTTPAGTTVRITDEVDGPVVRIVVSDDGPGITGEMASALFRRFGPAPAAAEGAGLGLSLAREVVRAHGGGLWHRQCPEGGTDFVLELPVRRPAARAGAQAGTGTPSSKRRSRASGTPSAGVGRP